MRKQPPKTSKFYSRCKKCDIEKTVGGGYHHPPLGSPKVNIHSRHSKQSFPFNSFIRPYLFSPFSIPSASSLMDPVSVLRSWCCDEDPVPEQPRPFAWPTPGQKGARGEEYHLDEVGRGTTRRQTGHWNTVEQVRWHTLCSPGLIIALSLSVSIFCVSRYVSVSVSISISLPVCLSVSVSLSLSLSILVSLSLSLCLYVSLSVSSLYISVCLSPSNYLCKTVCLHACLSLSLSACLSLFLYPSMSVCLFVFL